VSGFEATDAYAMKILLADKLPAPAVARLEEAGDEVVMNSALGADDLPDAIAGFEALVVRSTKVTAAALENADQLALIVRAGAGTNTIDTGRAAELGIFVCNVPGKNALAVAELTLGLLIAVDRHIAVATADLRQGKWNKSAYSKADGLFGATIGIIGLGDIGIATAARATGFGMDVIAVTKAGRSEAMIARALDAGVRFVDDLDQLLAESDIVSLHVPGSPDTTGMVDAAFLAKMNDGAILLNTSRGDVVDEAALIEAMDNRGIRAGLDVFADEPGSGTADFTSALAQHQSVVATHHVGASTGQAQEAVADGTVDTINAYRRGSVANCVNLQAVPARAATLTIRHHDRVGVLAAVLAILRRAELNIANMSNQVFSGAHAAVATIDVGRPVSDETLAEIKAHEHVINVSVTPA
jgi:D-3-phosphoglycerate dehydrogenase / 2-oxoglutarate reductase